MGVGCGGREVPAACPALIGVLCAGHSNGVGLGMASRMFFSHKIIRCNYGRAVTLSLHEFQKEVVPTLSANLSAKVHHPTGIPQPKYIYCLQYYNWHRLLLM